MKIYLSGLFFMLSITLSAQEKAPFFFNEFNISINQAMPVHPEIEGRLGWGLGMNRIFWKDRRFNLVTGLKYNRINLYVDKIVPSRWHRRMEVNYNFNYLQIPLLIRYGVGNRIRPFAEAGPLLAIGLPSRYTGSEIYTNPYNNAPGVKDFNEKGSPRSYIGLMAGLGVGIQLEKVMLIPKITYQQHLDAFDAINDEEHVHFIQFSLAAQL